MPYLLFIFLMIASISSLSGQTTSSLNSTDSLLFQQGISAQENRQYQSSNQYFRQVSKQLKSQEKWSTYLEVQNQIARNYWKMEKLDSANIICQAVSNSPHLETGSLTEAKLYYNMGAYYRLKGELNTSLEHYQKAYHIFSNQTIQDSLLLIAIYKQMALVHQQVNQAEEAITNLDKALKLCLLVYPPNSPNTSTIYNQLGLAKFNKGQKKEGTILIKKGFQNAKKYYGKNHPNMIPLNNNMCSFYKKNKNYNQAKIYGKNALRLALETIGDKNQQYSTSCTLLGSLYYKNKEDSIAIDYYHKAMLAFLPDVSSDIAADSIPDFKNTTIPNFSSLVKSFYKKAMVMNRNFTKFPTKDNLMSYKNHLIAAQELVQAAQLNIDNIDDKALLLNYAYQFTTMKALFFKSLNIDGKYPQDLTSVIEDMDANRSLLLRLTLSTEDAMLFGELPDSTKQTLSTLQNEITQLKQVLSKKNTVEEKNTLQNKLFDRKLILHQLEQGIKVDYPKYFELKNNIDRIKLKTIQEELLDKKTMLVEYMMIGQSFLITAIVTKDTHNIVYLPMRRDDFLPRLKQFRQNLSDLSFIQSQKNNGISSFEDDAIFLYEKILSSHLTDSNITDLIIIPDGELNRIPFETLIYKNTNNQKASFKTLNYLSNKYTIRYAYSAKLLLDAKQNRTNAATDILAFAASYNPSTTSNPIRKELVALEGVQQEVKTLQENFRGEFYLAENATESVIKKVDFSQFGILHLAMHGLLNKENPMQSAMAFTEDTASQEDGFLYAHEITNMNINTNLVVLSACETGDGKHQKIEGIMSLGRSFVYAGTPSIIMSLWQVSDFSTAQIMQRFYQNLAEGQSKSEALRNAKFHYLELVKDNKDLFSHPFFWGAFISLGDDSNIKVQPPINYIAWAIGGVSVIVLLGGLFYWRKRENKSAA